MNFFIIHFLFLTVAGISGTKDKGCNSLVLAGGYSDDKDLGYEFTYSGEVSTIHLFAPLVAKVYFISIISFLIKPLIS